MPLNVTNAINAYASAAKALTGSEAREKNPAGDFASLVKDATVSAVEIGEKSEKMSMQALAGKADLTDVVTAVTEAELTLQTIIAVRDKVIQAYQEIIRMPL